ncbi:MAG TPA: hypothetical protein VGO50_01100 [Pyrinomonadaceae bacterium]|jgi:hypothetical protein|nr:hypothetical protein [Pyrinomonadaceae bacterium]
MIRVFPGSVFNGKLVTSFLLLSFVFFGCLSDRVAARDPAPKVESEVRKQGTAGTANTPVISSEPSFPPLPDASSEISSIFGGEPLQQDALKSALDKLRTAPKEEAQGLDTSDANDSRSLYVRKLASAYSSLKSTSFIIAVLGHEYHLDDNSVKDLVGVKYSFDKALADLANFYADDSYNKQLIHLAGHSRFDQDFFSERLQLEVARQKKQVSEETYQTRKAEIEKQYSDQAAAAFAASSNSPCIDAKEVKLLLQTAKQNVENAKEDLSALGVLVKVSPIVISAMSLPFMLLWGRRRDDREKEKEIREKKEAELLELKRKELESKVFQLEAELRKKSLEEHVIVPSSSEIEKYACSNFIQSINSSVAT